MSDRCVQTLCSNAVVAVAKLLFADVWILLCLDTKLTRRPNAGGVIGFPFRQFGKTRLNGP